MTERAKDPVKQAAVNARWQGSTSHERRQATSRARLARTTDVEHQAAVETICAHHGRLTGIQQVALRAVLPPSADES